MYRFDDLSRLILSFCIISLAKLLTVDANGVIVLIQTLRLTLGAVLKWIFSKLPSSNMGFSSVSVAGDFRVQVATGRRYVLELEFCVRIFLNFTEGS